MKTGEIQYKDLTIKRYKCGTYYIKSEGDNGFKRVMREDIADMFNLDESHITAWFR